MPTVPADEDALTHAIITWLPEDGRYGDCRVTVLLQAAGWRVDKNRIRRIWRRAWPEIPHRYRPPSRIRLNDRSCVRLRPLHDR